MGNTASGSHTRLAGGVELLRDYDVQYECRYVGVCAHSSLGSSRLLRATRVRHDAGALIIKTFIKPDSGLRLRGLVRRLLGKFSCVVANFS